jgi:hypothetical protein
MFESVQKRALAITPDGLKLRRLIVSCKKLLSERGEAAGVSLAKITRDLYRELDKKGQERFFAALLAEFSPDPVQVLAASEQARSYSPVSGLLALGLGELAARIVATALGLVLLVGCAIVGRRGDDRRSLTLALAAALVLSPIVWLHYFVLLLVPIALARRTFSVLWNIPEEGHLKLLAETERFALDRFGTLDFAGGRFSAGDKRAP